METNGIHDNTPHPGTSESGRGSASHGHVEKLSIWFFCGILMLAYGVVLFCQGIYEHFGHMPTTVLARLEPTLWWGVLLTALGGFYTIRFRPRSRDGRD